MAASDIATTSRIGYIYVIAGGDLLKIGRSWAPGGRVREMQTGSPVELRLVHEVPVPGKTAPKVERRAHRILQDFHVRGEWYRCTDIEAVAAITDAVSAFSIKRVTKDQVDDMLGRQRAIALVAKNPEYRWMFEAAFPDVFPA